MEQTPASGAGNGTPTRPYLIRALHDWCTDNGFTPYLAVYVDAGVQVPMEYVKNHEIVLNVGFEATSGLTLGNDYIEFKARFGGVARDIVVPVDHVVAIYAKENGQGMAFPVPVPGGETGDPVAPRQPGAAVARAPAEGRGGAPSGLRLASVEGVPSADGPQAAPASTPAAPAESEPPVPPEGGPAGGGAGRPTLKRIK